MTVLWEDQFTADHFHDGRYVGPAGAFFPWLTAVGGGHLTSPNIDWMDTANVMPASCLRARVWVDVISNPDASGGEIGVGLRAGWVGESLRKTGAVERTVDAEQHVLLAKAAYDPTAGRQLTVETHNEFDFNLGIEAAVARAPLESGHFEVVLTSDAAFTASTPSDTVEGTLSHGVHDFARLIGTTGYVSLYTGSLTPVVLSGWGYEFDFTPPPSTVVAGDGNAGSLRR